MVPTMDFRRRTAEKTIQYLVLPAMLLAVWQVFFQTGFLRAMTLPPPTRLARTFLELLENVQLLRHVEISVLRVLEGFALASLLGTIRDVVPVDLPRPRDRSSHAFARIRKTIYEEFLDEGDGLERQKDEFSRYPSGVEDIPVAAATRPGFHAVFQLQAPMGG